MTEYLETDGHDVTDDAHRADCAGCTAVWADLERISAQARELPRLTPSRDLWTGIESRIADRAVDAPLDLTATRSTHRRWMSHQTVRLATAASLLVAATATVTWGIATGGLTLPGVPSSTEVTTASTPAAAEPDLQLAFGVPTDVVAQMQKASLDATVATMDREIEDLEKLLSDRRTSLDPKTVAVLEASMAVIDAAIAESRKALAADPASRFLATQYARAYTSKLTLLRDAATLPAGD